MTHTVPDSEIDRLREAVRIVRGQMTNPKSGVVGHDAFVELVRSSTALLKASRTVVGEETHG